MGEKKTKISKAVRLKYNILARIYDFIYRNYIKKTIQLAIGSLTLTGAEKLLDIGCGTGALAQPLLQKWPTLDITGIDLSDDMLEQAKKKLASFPNARFLQADFLDIKLPEESFDVAFSLSNLHYFANPNAAFQKVQHLLKKGGQFVIIDWDRNSFKGRLYNWYMSKADPSFTKAYTLSEATQMLKENGFQIIRSDGFKVGFLWTMMHLVSIKA